MSPLFVMTATAAPTYQNELLLNVFLSNLSI